MTVTNAFGPSTHRNNFHADQMVIYRSTEKALTTNCGTHKCTYYSNYSNSITPILYSPSSKGSWGLKTEAKNVAGMAISPGN